jgi:hypothetical protein
VNPLAYLVTDPPLLWLSWRMWCTGRQEQAMRKAGRRDIRELTTEDV